MKSMKGMKRELSELSNRVIELLIHFNVALLKDGLQSFVF